MPRGGFRLTRRPSYGTMSPSQFKKMKRSIAEDKKRREEANRILQRISKGEVVTSSQIPTHLQQFFNLGAVDKLARHQKAVQDYNRSVRSYHKEEKEWKLAQKFANRGVLVGLTGSLKQKAQYLMRDRKAYERWKEKEKKKMQKVNIPKGQKLTITEGFAIQDVDTGEVFASPKAKGYFSEIKKGKAPTKPKTTTTKLKPIKQKKVHAPSLPSIVAPMPSPSMRFGGVSPMSMPTFKMPSFSMSSAFGFGTPKRRTKVRVTKKKRKRRRSAPWLDFFSP